MQPAFLGATRIIALLIGVAALLAGRRLFWLFVGAAGFLTGFTFAADRKKQYPFVLDSLRAVPVEGPGGGVLVSWETVAEQELIGFDVIRDSDDGAPSIAVNPVLIPAMGDEVHSTTYHFLDRSAGEGVRYRIQGITINGLASRSDPAPVERAESR